MTVLARRHYDDRKPEGGDLVQYRGGARQIVGRVLHAFTPDDDGAFAYLATTTTPGGPVRAVLHHRGLGGEALAPHVRDRLLRCAALRAGA